MSEVSHQDGGDGADDESLTGREIEGPDGKMMKTAPNPRDAIIERVADEADDDRRRTAEEDAALHGADGPDMGYRDGEGGDDAEAAAAKAAALAADSDGAASRAPLNDPPVDPNALPESLKTDPAAEFIVMVDGQPMLRAKIDGQDRFLPLGEVQASVQKGIAGEQRLQDASEWAKTLAERERVVGEVEKGLIAKAKTLESSPSAPTSDVDDQGAAFDPEVEAKDIVQDLFTGDQDDAAEKLAKALRAARASGTTPVDVDELVKRAAAQAKAEFAAEQAANAKAAEETDMNNGYTQFKLDYPDLMANKQFYAVADSELPAIEKEHPDWNWSQRFQEAGKRARGWISENVKGTDEDPNQAAADSLNDRHERKRDLTPMPQQRQGVQPRAQEEKPQTPAEAFAEMKKDRGQPT